MAISSIKKSKIVKSPLQPPKPTLIDTTPIKGVVKYPSSSFNLKNPNIQPILQELTNPFLSSSIQSDTFSLSALSFENILGEEYDFELESIDQWTELTKEIESELNNPNSIISKDNNSKNRQVEIKKNEEILNKFKDQFSSKESFYQGLNTSVLLIIDEIIAINPSLKENFNIIRNSIQALSLKFQKRNIKEKPQIIEKQSLSLALRNSRVKEYLLEEVEKIKLELLAPALINQEKDDKVNKSIQKSKIF